MGCGRKLGRKRKTLLRIGWAIAAVLLAASVLLSGCGKGETASPPEVSEIAGVFSGSFSASANITIDLPSADGSAEEPLELTAQIVRSEDCCSVEVLSPEHLAGLTFTIDSVRDGRLTVSYKGITIQPDSMPGGNLGELLAGALTALSNPEELTLSESAEGWCVTGETDAGSFAMLLGTNDHLPLALTLPDARVSITFTAFEAMSVFRPDRVEEDFAPSQEPNGGSDESSGTEGSNDSGGSAEAKEESSGEETPSEAPDVSVPEDTSKSAPEDGSGTSL